MNTECIMGYLKFFRDANDFLRQILDITFCNILISFFLSAITARISFNVFLITEPTLGNLLESLKRIEEIINISNYKKFIRDYCITTGLLVTAIINLQFRYETSWHTVIIYSIFGPYLIRDKLYRMFKEKKYRQLLKP